jgi:hypothetical protein
VDGLIKTVQYRVRVRVRVTDLLLPSHCTRQFFGVPGTGSLPNVLMLHLAGRESPALDTVFFPNIPYETV